MQQPPPPSRTPGCCPSLGTALPSPNTRSPSAPSPPCHEDQDPSLLGPRGTSEPRPSGWLRSPENLLL